MIKSMSYICCGTIRGYLVLVEDYAGIEYVAFFWKFMDAQNWDPRPVVS